MLHLNLFRRRIKLVELLVTLGNLLRLSLDDLLGHPSVGPDLIKELRVGLLEALVVHPSARIAVASNSAESLGNVSVMLKDFTDEKLDAGWALVVIATHQVELSDNATITRPQVAKEGQPVLVQVHFDCTLKPGGLAHSQGLSGLDLRLINVDQSGHVIQLVTEELSEGSRLPPFHARHHTFYARVQHLVATQV